MDGLVGGEWKGGGEKGSAGMGEEGGGNLFSPSSVAGWGYGGRWDGIGDEVVGYVGGLREEMYACRGGFEYGKMEAMQDRSEPSNISTTDCHIWISYHAEE